SCSIAFILQCAASLLAQTAPTPLGLFQDHADLGSVVHAGSAQYNAAHGSYTLTGSGENVWFTAAAFQFAWKRVTGDITLTADVSFPEKAATRIARLCSWLGRASMPT